MLRRVMNLAGVRIANLAQRSLAFTERTPAGHHHAHPRNDVVETPARPAAMGAPALRGNRRVMR